jgi:flagellar hook-associated protein 3 FlgL
MRIATQNAFERGLSTLQSRQGELAQLQEQLTSGKRVARASDDPAAAARAERALASQMRVEAEQRALEASRNVLTLTEGALADAGELLQQAREAVVAAGNATYTDKERASLAQALRGIREQLLGIANRGDGAGSWLFGGQGADPPPFVDAPGGVVLHSSGGEMLSPNAEPLPLTLDGRDTWLQVHDPETGGTDLSPFALLDRLADELATPGRSGAEITETVRSGLAQMDAVNDHLLARRARVGEKLNRVDSVQTRLWQESVTAQAERSAAEDLDMVQAVSDFQNKQTGYDAALKAYSMVQRMSLFQYLNP